MWFSFFIYSVLTALLPGPNNILALNSSMKSGYKNSKTLLFGIYSGFTAVMILAAFFTEFILNSYSFLLDYLKYLGAVYLLYLAWSVMSGKPSELHVEKEESVSKAATDFWKGFFLQFVNVKIIIYGITAFSSFIFPQFQELWIILVFAIFLSFIGNSATWIWAIAGEKLHLFLNKHYKIINMVMGILLLYCAVSLFL
ncbi:LysE family transporter [Chryseobacterium sp. MEBOG07]|uniref:LysE family transporter n=1 Tax=Chryseobacterium sp. MEBOG07 TaxID=2879939 RepID=UPI001EFFA01F|nr:LysE family transporter [Chryseobacterium sp. MEBOG07]UKB77446.1 LysE family transporter [Chryseobacterium sp. MEBOG07]